MPIIVAFHIPGSAPPPPPPVTTDAWTEVIPTSSFLEEMPTDAELVTYAAGGAPLRGNSGPYNAVFHAWCSVSFDPATGYIYAHGGGHTNYGGNEVYKGDMSLGTWTRLTNPSPYLGENYNSTCPLPVTGPPSTHTYSSICWNPGRDTVMLIGPEAGYSSSTCSYSTMPIPYLYEFDPATNTWTQFDSANGGYSFTIYANNRMYSVSNNGDQIIVDNSRNVTHVAGSVALSENTPVYDTVNNKIWTWRSNRSRLYEWDITDTRLNYRGYITAPPDITTVKGINAGVAFRNGIIWFYAGHDVFTYDPSTSVWKILPSSDQPGNGERTYSKFHYWPSEDKFVFVTENGAVYLLDPTELTTEIIVDPNAIRATVNGNQFTTITAAAATLANGDTMIINPGTYREAFRIDADNVTIQASGVTLDRAIYGGKSTIVQYGSNLTIDGVTAYGFTCSNANNSSGNGSLVRMEPGAVGLTVRNTQVLDTEGGIAITGGEPFTDPLHIPQGDVLIEGCKAERCGGDGGQSHGIYVGYNDSLTIRNSEFLDGTGLGHLVKARPLVVTIEDSTLDGKDGQNSRLIDMPCGGVLTLRRCTLVQSSISDNKEVIGISLENECWTTGSIINIEDTDITVKHASGRLHKSNQEPVIINCSGTNTITGIADPC